MNNDDDDILAGIDLHAWRLPPPSPLDRAALLVRALAPALAPPRRSRLRWLIAGIVLANAALAALIVIVLRRPPETRTVVLPAGGGGVDAQVAEVLQRLDEKQRELEARLRETQELRALVLQLQEKARACEERDHTVPKKAVPAVPAPTPPAPSVFETDESCDEVSCVLRNYDSGCCDKYKKTAVPRAPSGPPESLDRAMISNGIASVKASVAACGGSAKGLVKVHVRVGGNGLVTNVEVAATPDAPLGGCVAAAVQKAVFPKTKNGGSFSYPFVF